MTIYHYCAAQTFHSIVQNRSIWLSSLSESNDSMEGHWISDILNRLSHKHGLPDPIRTRILDPIKHYRKYVDGLGLCLSRNGDLLSQWRGYAEDGTGFSIGFNEGYLTELAEITTERFSIDEVIYDADMQALALTPAFERIKGYIEEGAYGAMKYDTLLTSEDEKKAYAEHNKKLRELSGKADMALGGLIKKFFHFKSDAFAEEDEVRLISTTYHPIDKNDKTEDAIRYRHARGKIVPYREIELEKMVHHQAIDDVVLGPKNRSNLGVIERFLVSRDFHGASVRISKATYC